MLKFSSPGGPMVDTIDSIGYGPYQPRQPRHDYVSKCENLSFFLKYDSEEGKNNSRDPGRFQKCSYQAYFR